MVEVNVHDEKYEVLEARANEKGFSDAEEYIDHLLGQIVEKIRKEKQQEEFSSEEEEEVKKRLEELGYM